MFAELINDYVGPRVKRLNRSRFGDSAMKTF
jgi:hypothetical protein